MKRVVITGLGALSPIGNNVQDFWKNLTAGVSGAAPITKFDTTLYKTKFACEVKGFVASEFFDVKEARKMDPFTQYGMVAADQAIADSGLLLDEKLNKNRVGVIWGAGNGGILTFEEEVKSYVTGGYIPRFSPFLIPKMIVDITAGMISIKHGFRGVNFATVSACATSNTALIEAFNYIRWGKADVIVSGGSEAPITEAGVGGFSAMKALSTRNDSPETASRPFDTDRDGFVIGEGAAALILESYDHAIARGAKIYAEVIGGGMSADAYHLTSTHPEGLGAQLAAREAMEEAGIQPHEVDYVNMHATSTPVGDLSELKAITSLFGEHINKLQISATKSMTGHLLGAAGAIEAIACVLAIKNNLVPPTINTTNLDPGIPTDLNLTLGKAVPKEINIAMSNTFGFGGHNAVTLFKKYL